MDNAICHHRLLPLATFVESLPLSGADHCSIALLGIDHCQDRGPARAELSTASCPRQATAHSLVSRHFQNHFIFLSGTDHWGIARCAKASTYVKPTIARASLCCQLPHRARDIFSWSNKREKAKLIKSKLKCLLITFFDVKGLVHYEFVPEGQTINQHYYLDVLRRLREAVRQKRPENGIRKIVSCIMTTHGHIRPSLYNSIWINTELLYYPSHPIHLTLLPTTFSFTLKLKKS
ncbi:hypothetical protein LAZ67_6000220 [Cordylochernes scorpioides]|uniref:Uncharacterized protein n=1 Tax=Cordylochernes scorpioides TaxID=51811 RepID=A0ABY6KLC7_9ARAC|nr:hypothetical protein LAZ67_6000220 [Cordylochernes scorpioides]